LPKDDAAFHLFAAGGNQTSFNLRGEVPEVIPIVRSCPLDFLEGTMFRKTIPLIMAVIASLMPTTAANAVIAEGATVGVILNKLHDQLADLIDKSRDSGDFITWRVAITGRDLIDSFQKSNIELLNKAFKDIDKTQQDMLRGIDANADKLVSGTKMTLDAADALTGEWSQIISTTIVGSSRPYIVSYSPRVLVPEGERTVRLRIIGPNLGRSDARIKNTPFASIRPSNPVDQAAVFNLNREAIGFPETESIVQRLSIAYNVPKYLVFNDTASNDVELWLLPVKMGSYNITTRVEATNREITNRIVNLGQFRGRNSRIPRAVLVPDTSLGWRLDLTRRNEIRLIQGGADKGRCEGIDDQSITENGLTMFARVDNRDRPLNRRDAWTDCSISLPLYRSTKVEVDGAGADGDLSWTKDISIKIPNNLISMNIKVDLFDKRSRVFTGSGSDKYVDIRKEGDQLIFRPIPPRDF
jgi:hypothetical protein